jgi:AraC-like DNA-binding protein
MRSISYYSFNDKRKNGLGNCSICLNTSPLIVNCAGRLVSSKPFITNNTEGRLDYYLMYILSGELVVRFEDGERLATMGDSIIFPPGFNYYYKHKASGEPLSYLWVHFTGSAAGQYLCDIGLDSLPALRHSKKDALAELHFERMFELYSRDDGLRAHALSAVLLETLVELTRSWQVDEKEKSLSRSLAFINSRYTEEIRISELASLESLSPSRYHVIFKERMGMPPSEYIIELRLRHASGLLSSTDMPIGEISSLVGYDDQRFFSRIFKKKLGMSTSEYRRMKI